jgi:DNA replication and repair protein RecF
VVAALDAALAETPAEPFARPLLAYASETPDDLAAALHAGRRRDRAAGRTLSGPHRDDLAVTLAAKHRPAADCSTGEQKAMLIAIVLAHAALLDAARPRVLLLDEVAAHLDPLRRAALFERLRAVPGQYWLTGTETAPFAEILAEAAVWEVREGAVTLL